MYNKFLITENGGVDIDLNKINATQDAHIFIGLGGLGIKCLSHIKHEVCHRITDISRIRFLGVDTDESAFEPLKQNERFFIHPEGFFSVSATRAGARALFLDISGSFFSKLHRIMSAAVRQSVDNEKINVYIITGLSGNTGSGIMLDVCYAVRKMLSFFERQSRVYGMFFMPDTVCPAHVQGVQRRETEANGYAAMQELDRAMNYPQNGGSWVQDYDGGYYVDCSLPPVDFAHLITSACDGVVSADGENSAVRAATDYLFELVRQHDPGETPAASQLTPQDAASGYFFVGAARMEAPTQKITTYAACELFKRMFSTANNSPQPDEVKDFITRVGLTEDVILRELSGNTAVFPVFCAESADVVDMCRSRACGDPVLPEFKKHYSRLLEEHDRQLKLRYDQLIDENGPIMSRIKVCIDQTMADITKGPDFAASLLYETSSKYLYDTLNYAKGKIRCQSQMIEDIYRNLNECAIALERANMFNRRRLAEEYTDAVHSYYIALARAEQYKMLEKLEYRLLDMMRELNENSIERLAHAIGRLRATFRENSLYFESNHTCLQDELVGIADVQADIDSYIDCYDINTAYSNFIQTLQGVEDPDDDNAVCEAVASFLYVELHPIAARDVSHYLGNLTHANICATIVAPLYERAIQPFSFVPQSFTVTSVPTCVGGNSPVCDRISVLRVACAVPLSAYPLMGRCADSYNNLPSEGRHIITD